MISLDSQPRIYPGTGYGLTRPMVMATLRVRLDRPPNWETVDAAMLEALSGAAGQDVKLRLPDPECDPLHALVLRALFWTAALQQAAGLPVFEVGLMVARRALPSGEADCDVVSPYVYRAATLQSLGWAVRALNALLATVGGITDDQAIQEARTQAARQLGVMRERAPVGSNTLRFLRAAQSNDIPWQPLAGNSFELGYGCRSRWLDSSFTDRTSSLGAGFARNKGSAARLLARAGLPVPPHARAESARQAEEIASRLGYPVVVKPMDRDGGVAVAAGLETPEAVRRAFEFARKQSSNVLVEKHVPGLDFRLTVFHGRLIWAIQRIPGGVTGDGEHTVAELLAALNADPRRGRTATATLQKLDLNEEAMELLGEAGLTPESVPEGGLFVRLRRAANIASGGTPQEVTSRVHPDNRRLAERAAEVLRLDLAGVDLLIPDISRSWLETGATICEVNAQPQLGILTGAHLYGQVLNALLPGAGRIPLVLVVGFAGAHAVARGLQQEWQRRGLAGAALASNDGVWIGNDRVSGTGIGFFRAGRAVLSDPGVEAVALVGTAAEILQAGLPFDCCDAVILEAATPEHPGDVAAQMDTGAFSAHDFGRMCALALPHTRGAVVFNSADPWCAAQAARIRGARVIPAGPGVAGLVAAAVRALMGHD